MGTWTFTRKDKAFNTIYRIILFVCLAASAAAVYGILSIIMYESYDNINEEMIYYMTIMTYGYYAVLIGSAAAVLFSILSYKSGCVISLFFRTALSLGIFILDFCGRNFMRISKLICDLVNKYGFDYIQKIPSPEDVGLTREEMEKFQNIIDHMDEILYFPLIIGSYFPLFIGIFLGAVVYFILSLTSLHSLFRQRNITVSSGIPMDDELAGYYENSSYNDINNL